MSRKKFYDGEKFLKGFANHRRLEMIELLASKPGLSVEQIVSNLKINYQTGSEHLRRLVQSGVVYKHRQGNNTLLELTPLASRLFQFTTKLLQKP